MKTIPATKKQLSFIEKLLCSSAVPHTMRQKTQANMHKLSITQAAKTIDTLTAVMKDAPPKPKRSVQNRAEALAEQARFGQRRGRKPTLAPTTQELRYFAQKAMP